MSGFVSFLKKSVLPLFKEEKGFEKILSSIETAKSGARAWPKRDTQNDKKVGMRWDWGDKFEEDGVKYRNIILQANKNAEQEALNKLAARDSHAKLATVPLRIDEPGTEDAFVDTWTNVVKK